MTVTDTRPAESWAEQSARAEVIRAQAEAARAKAAAEAEAREIANRVKAAKAAAEIAEGETEAEAVRQAAAAKQAEQQREQREQRRERERAARSAARWRRSAASIAVICVLVSLPLQMQAFYSPHAWFLVLAPLVIEGLAWAMLAGAAAAIDDRRPSWHYRLGALAVALFAATINYFHGSIAYGTATGLGAAFCSLAGPLVWDLHEHGRISQRDGKVPRRQRRAATKAAAEKARAEKAAAAKAEAARQAIEQARAAQWEQVWQRAIALAAAVGELHVTEQIWRRAWADIHGTDPGDTADSLAARMSATARIKELGAQSASTSKPQAVPSVPPTPKPSAKPSVRTSATRLVMPPERRTRKSAVMSAGARRQASVTARAAEEDPAGAEAERQSARMFYLSEAAAGRKWSGARLAQKYSRGKTWGYDRITEATR